MMRYGRPILKLTVPTYALGDLVWITSQLRNAVPALVPASPAHRLISGRYALLEFPGRRCGRTHQIPFACVREGTRGPLSADSPWWRNSADRPVVRLRLRGQVVTDSADLVPDDREAAELSDAIVQGVSGFGRPTGLANQGGRASEEHLLGVTTGGRHSIDVQLVGSR